MSGIDGRIEEMAGAIVSTNRVIPRQCPYNSSDRQVPGPYLEWFVVVKTQSRYREREKRRATLLFEGMLNGTIRPTIFQCV